MATEKLKNNKNKIIFAVILSFIFATTAFFALKSSGFTVVLAEQTSADNVGKTVENSYKISTAEDLISFSDYVNAGNVSVNAVLTSDIVLNEKVITADGKVNSGDLQTFVPIGNENNIFQGTFDGKGFTVSGLYFSDENKCYVGLFGRIGVSGVIKNVKVEDSYFSGRQFVGGIVGDNGGSVENCTFNGKTAATFEGLGGIAGGNFGVISGSSNYAAVEGGSCVNVDTYTTKDSNGNIVTKTTTKNCVCEAVGGVTGANYGTVEGCQNFGAVSGGSNIGGITGFNNGPVKNCFNEGNLTCQTNTSYAYAGGAVGYNTTLGFVENVYNTGNVFTNRYYVGGIMGFTEAGKPIYIKNCYNAGNITGGMYVGGIIGYNQIDVENCYNHGNVTGPRYVGGILGYSRQRKNSSVSIKNCYNIGDIVDNGTWHLEIGSITGYNNGCALENCYYLYSDGKVADSNKGSIKTSDSEFKSGRIAYLLNGSAVVGVWRQTLGGDDYPNFTSEYVYYNDINQNFYNHFHNLSVTIQDNVLYLRCDLADCVEQDRGSVTILLPTDFVYDGSEKEVVVLNELKDDVAVKISYSSTDYDLSSGETPKKAGDYTAHVTVLDKTFNFGFEITSAKVIDLDTSAIEKVETIDDKNVELKDKTALNAAKQSLQKALDDYQDNYKPSKIAQMKGTLENVNAALKVITNVENVLSMIDGLPDEIQIENEAVVNKAAKAYDNLSDYEKTLVDESNYNKLQKSILDLEKAIEENENVQNPNGQNGVFGAIFAIILALIGIILFILSFIF